MNRKKVDFLMGRQAPILPSKVFTGYLTKEQVKQAWHFMGPTIQHNLHKQPLDVVLATVWWEAFSMAVDGIRGSKNEK